MKATSKMLLLPVPLPSIYIFIYCTHRHKWYDDDIISWTHTQKKKKNESSQLIRIPQPTTLVGLCCCCSVQCIFIVFTWTQTKWEPKFWLIHVFHTFNGKSSKNFAAHCSLNCWFYKQCRKTNGVNVRHNMNISCVRVNIFFHVCIWP